MSTTYWPDSQIPKSTNNGFSMGLGGDWKAFKTAGIVRANSTKQVERSRANGTDRSTFRGMSAKADAAIRPIRPMKLRAPRPASNSSMIRELLAAGPKDGEQLAQESGLPRRSIKDALTYDIEQGRVTRLYEFKPFRYALVSEA